MDEGAKRDEGLILARERTDLAAARNQLAADRTLLAWIRTAVALIAFGFSIYRVMESLYKSGMAVFPRSQGPRNLGLTLIAAGTSSLLAASIAYVRYVKLLGFHNRYELWKVTIVLAFLAFSSGFWSSSVSLEEWKCFELAAFAWASLVWMHLTGNAMVEILPGECQFP